MTPLPFEFIALPQQPDTTELQALAHRFREFRLHALKSSPQAFAASYEVESRRELQHTADRLSNPKALHLIAIAKTNTKEKSAVIQPEIGGLLNGRWVGMIVLLGPEESSASSAVSAQSDPFARMTGSAHRLPDTQGVHDDGLLSRATLHFHLNGVFVDPETRKGGLGRALITAALNMADTKARGSSSDWTCTILVDSMNVAARSLYEQAGFAVTGEEAYMQQPRALVGDESEPKQLTALHMELRGDIVP